MDFILTQQTVNEHESVIKLMTGSRMYYIVITDILIQHIIAFLLFSGDYQY